MTSGVLILTGQTASGKSALALRLAERFGAEIVGADSRQIYRGMPIGTAAPSPEDLARVRHHLVGFLGSGERYSSARFVADALAAIDDIQRRAKRALVVGGTGFYVRALTGDVALSPVRDEALRERVAREARIHPPDVLADWLRALAPERAAGIATNDRYRVTRALEIALSRRDDAAVGKEHAARAAAPRDEARAGAPHETLRTRGTAYRKVMLEVGSDELLKRIEARTDAMLAAGLVDEAERIGADAVAADAVGYREALAYLRGWSTFGELRTQLVRSTRRYAKRQATWFRTEPELQRVPDESAFEGLVAVANDLGWR
ncbi:MAG TPA: tRNA (adenosine(37)-N6)-dimethylallyltransferase MiaA [Candidatus Baltobacteraceae bacterium]|nr:tRNA (adenosine(37)-N6)-dimethylallyltransferase MiaA [Candidatus Baltobacteraceae bacterium]